jgi:SAM-dependent methyltransferase
MRQRHHIPTWRTEPAPDLTSTLERQESAWNERPLLRRLYSEWYRMIAGQLRTGDAPTVELGSGIGKLRDALPNAMLTDIQRTRWTDVVVDAERMPFADATIGNLVLFDVFHHLADPASFLNEAHRVLVPGGRVAIIDPYCSPVSALLYRTFHHERADLKAPAFDADRETATSPLASNQARTTLVFFRHADEFSRRWPQLAIVTRRRFATALYPLSGGFTGRPLLPQRLVRPLAVVDSVLGRLAGPALAFRCLVVLERSPS